MAPESQNEQINRRFDQAVMLLKQLIRTPSFSKGEDGTAQVIADFLQGHNVDYNRKRNNIWAKNRYFDQNKPTILLNSHHDTVKPNKNYTNAPFDAFEKDGKLFGLGSNDAGGALVSLISLFLYFYDKTDLRYNLILAPTAEEEISGDNGIASIVEELGAIDFAIVGEPTQMRVAVAEKGLLVVDCIANGTSTHAAHPNDNNSIYKAVNDIRWVENYEFAKESAYLGKVKMTTTVINAGDSHNVVPAETHFVLDIRFTEQYTNREIWDILKENMDAEVIPRSLKHNSSFIPEDHPLIKTAKDFGRPCYGSPTSSDQSMIPFPSLKMGPGKSTRSHSADEFIYLDEIKEGIALYINLLNEIM